MIVQLLIWLVRILTGVRPHFLEAPSERQRIYFANHTSNLDAVVIWTSLPPGVRQQVRPVAAHDYWTSNRLRLYFAEKVFNAILIERKRVTAGNNPIELILAGMGDANSIIIFPEGTRNTEPEIKEFKSGLYHIVKKRPEVELVPVFIDNLNRVLPKGESLPVPIICHITFGTVLPPIANESKQEFLERARQAVIALKP